MAPETIVAAVAANTSWKKNLASSGTDDQLRGSKFVVVGHHAVFFDLGGHFLRA